jgi:ribosomal protein L40E
MICIQCQTPNPHGAKFCTECGSALKPRCPQCRTELPVSARFCHECGTRVAESGTPPPTTVSPATQPTEGARTPPARTRPASGDGAEIPRTSPPDPGLEIPGLAERRQTTVIFSDLASFTSLSQRLDPEDLNTVVHAYYAVCRAVCQRYGGHIANYLGDGVLIMFGYPKAHEDDAHRAVRTGLGILEGDGLAQHPPRTGDEPEPSGAGRHPYRPHGRGRRSRGRLAEDGPRRNPQRRLPRPVRRCPRHRRRQLGDPATRARLLRLPEHRLPLPPRCQPADGDLLRHRGKHGTRPPRGRRTLHAHPAHRAGSGG